jgi:drug/metabolite transporter (DMT)-like permease
LAPVIGLLAAFVEFGELPLLNELIGLILILSGIFIMLILASRPASK